MARTFLWFAWVFVSAAPWLLSTRTADAAPWEAEHLIDLDQPEVVPRRVLDAPFVHTYASPDTTKSFPHARWETIANEAYRQEFRDAHRIRRTGGVPEDLRDRAREQQTAEERAIVRELEIGYRLYRMGELKEATRSLQDALDAVEDSGVPWANEALVVDAWQTLARAYQERAAGSPAERSELASRMRIALQQWIRMRPRERIDENRYPLSFVEAWRQVYFEQLASSAAVLSMREKSARYVSKTLDVDVVADVRIARSLHSGTIAVRVYDAETDRFAYDAILPWTGEEDHLREQLSMAFSIAQECLGLVRVEKEERKRLLSSNFFSAESLLFFYSERPTSRAFLNSGVRLAGHHYVTPVVGFYADLSVAFSRRDRAGELLNRIQSQGVSAGATFQYKRDRVRLFFDTGLEFSRHSEVEVTSSFWCRVSGGTPQELDSERGCDAADVFTQRASWLAGIRLGAGVSVRIAGPVWWQLTFTTTTYLLPFGRRGVDQPIGGTTGLVYGF